MYSNIEGKLVESNIITIAPKGLKEYIVNKFNSGVIIGENQVLELREAVLNRKLKLKKVNLLMMKVLNHLLKL